MCHQQQLQFLAYTRATAQAPLRVACSGPPSLPGSGTSLAPSLTCFTMRNPQENVHLLFEGSLSAGQTKARHVSAAALGWFSQQASLRSWWEEGWWVRSPGCSEGQGGGGPGHGAQVGLLEEAGWFGHSSGNTEALQSPDCGWSCEDEVVHPARRRVRDGWATWPNTHCHPVSAEAEHADRDPPHQCFRG